MRNGATSTSSGAFSTVDELEEAVRAVGWDIDYRQFNRGHFSAEFAGVECEELHLTSVRFEGHLHVRSEPPEGLFGVCLPNLDAGHVLAGGRTMNDGDLVSFPAGSELDFVTRGEIRNETLVVGESTFREVARSLAPSASSFSTRLATVHRGDPRHLAAIRSEVAAVRRSGGLDPETASNLLASIILWMAGTTSSFSVERRTGESASVIARRAEAFIEERYRDTIRLHDVCAFAGAGLRTLQRSFASYFQVSPTEYIKALRLNSARRELVAADPSDHSVTTIASANGFAHLGRFSVDYRTHFGESPRATLRGA